MSSFEELGCLSFAGGERGHADLDAFSTVAEELTPLTDEVQFPPLSGDMLL